MNPHAAPTAMCADNQVGLRLPLRDELGGNTGYVNGYITLDGGPVPDPASNLVIRAFTLGRGPECGVEGLAASAERLATSSSGLATYYRTHRWPAAAAAPPPRATHDHGPVSAIARQASGASVEVALLRE